MNRFEMPPGQSGSQLEDKKNKPNLFGSIKHKFEQIGQNLEIKKLEKESAQLRKFIQINPRGTGDQVMRAVRRVEQIEEELKIKQEKTA